MIFDMVIIFWISDLAKKSEFKKVNFCVGSINFCKQCSDVNWPLPFHNNSFLNNKKWLFFQHCLWIFQRWRMCSWYSIQQKNQNSKKLIFVLTAMIFLKRSKISFWQKIYSNFIFLQWGHFFIQSHKFLGWHSSSNFWLSKKIRTWKSWFLCPYPQFSWNFKQIKRKSEQE